MTTTKNQHETHSQGEERQMRDKKGIALVFVQDRQRYTVLKYSPLKMTL